jgi:hypothetical protein
MVLQVRKGAVKSAAFLPLLAGRRMLLVPLRLVTPSVSDMPPGVTPRVPPALGLVGLLLLLLFMVAVIPGFKFELVPFKFEPRPAPRGLLGRLDALPVLRGRPKAALGTLLLLRLADRGERGLLGLLPLPDPSDTTSSTSASKSSPPNPGPVAWHMQCKRFLLLCVVGLWA